MPDSFFLDVATMCIASAASLSVLMIFPAGWKVTFGALGFFVLGLGKVTAFAL